MYSLEGQIAIITGGARGIGEGICEIFCKAGATVALWDVLDSGEETANRISSNGGSIFFQKVDITSTESVGSAVEEIISNAKAAPKGNLERIAAQEEAAAMAAAEEAELAAAEEVAVEAARQESEPTAAAPGAD